MSSCSSLFGADDPLSGTDWVLTSLNGEPPLSKAQPTITFKSNEVNGSTGCNQYFGSYETSSNNLEISDLGWTEMACLSPEGVMVQEQQYMKTLQEINQYQINGDQLTLISTSSSLLFVRQ
jgi:putative lipoprotein